MIKVIHVASRGTLATKRRGILALVPVECCPEEQPSRKKLRLTQEPIAFNDDDLEGMIQLHDYALVVTAQINGFIVKRILIN